MTGVDRPTLAPMTTSVVGLVLGATDVRAVEIRRRLNGKHEVVAADREPYAATDLDVEVLDQGEIRDPDLVTDALLRLWARGRLTSRRVNVGVDGSAALVRRAELPLVDASQLRQAAALDIEELLSYPAHEAVFDVAEIGRRVDGDVTWYDTLVVAVHQPVLDTIRSAVGAAGLDVGDVRLRTASLFVGSFADGIGLAESSVAAVIGVEDDAIDVTIGDSDGLLFSRTLPTGIGESAASMASELESHLQAITGQQSGSAPWARTSAQAQPATEGISTAAEAVRRTLAHFSEEVGERSIGLVAVAGAQAHVHGLVTVFDDALSTPERRMSVEAVASPPSWPSGSEWNGFEASYGLALPRPERQFELVPDDVRITRARRRLNRIAFAAAAVVAAVLVNDGAARWARVLDERAAVRSSEQFVAELQATAARTAELRDERELVDSLEERATSLREDEIAMDGVVRDLAAAMPAESYLLSLEMRRSEQGELVTGSDATGAAILSVNGVTNDFRGVADWLASAEETGPISGVWLRESAFGPIGVAQEDRTVFSVEAVVTDTAKNRNEP